MILTGSTGHLDITRIITSGEWCERTIPVGRPPLSSPFGPESPGGVQRGGS
jgi:hypothetical protein